MDLNTNSNSWLSDETFDFDINSPTVDNDSVDEEVFIGPLTHKERCVASIVKEEEESRRTCTIEEIKPEEQAMLLRESALLGLRIKETNLVRSGTPLTRTSITCATGYSYSMKRPDCEVVLHESKQDNLYKDIEHEEGSKDKENIPHSEEETTKIQLLSSKNMEISSKVDSTVSFVSTNSNKSQTHTIELTNSTTPEVNTSKYSSQTKHKATTEMVRKSANETGKPAGDRRRTMRRSGLPTLRKSICVTKPNDNRNISHRPSLTPTYSEEENNSSKRPKLSKSIPGVAKSQLRLLPTKVKETSDAYRKQNVEGNKPLQKQVLSSGRGKISKRASNFGVSNVKNEGQDVRKHNDLATPVATSISKRPIIGTRRQLVRKV